MEALKLREEGFSRKSCFSEDTVEGFDGSLLHLESWLPDSKPRAVVLLIHSLGDHIHRYEHLARFFTSDGMAVMGIDLHGHGKSKGRRGMARFHNLLGDVKRLVDYAQLQHPGLPRILYGHGLGGNLAMTYAIRHNAAVSGIISASPWINSVYNHSPLYVSSLKTMIKIYPSFPITGRFKCSDLTNNSECIKAYNNDPLVHRNLSARLFFSIQQSGEYILQNKHKVNRPLLLMHGSNDRITSWHASADFAKYTSSNTTLKIWKGAYHELHNESENTCIFEYILHWINSIPGIH